MELILNNPYRALGLLVGASAAQLNKHITRIPRYIQAEQEIPDEFTQFGFDCLGDIRRTTEIITEAASKLNLDKDRMSAAMFWFFKGNGITDEAALDSLKEADLDVSTEIWTKLTATGEVNKRNSSAFQNLSTLLLCKAFKDSTINIEILEQGINLKLKFLESDFIKDFKSLATDETYKTSKKELQLLFLNQLSSEIDRFGGIYSNAILEVLNKQNFSAKEDFLNSFIKKPIEQIEKLIRISKEKRKVEKDVIIAGTELFRASKSELAILKSILGVSNIKYISVTDKVSDEILQCGIQLFNTFKDHPTYDPGEAAMKLFLQAKSLAIGSIAKQRCQENTENLQEWIDEKPEREKHKLIKEDLDFISDKLKSFQDLSDSVKNASNFINACRPKILKIKKVLGIYDELYINISSAIVHNAQNMLVSSVNKVVENPKSIFGAELMMIIMEALPVTFELGRFDMDPNLKANYKKNLESIKSLAKQFYLSTLSPEEQLKDDLLLAEVKLKEIQNQIYFKAEINNARAEMNKIKEWKLLRSEADKEKQINEQQQKINQLLKKSEQEKITQLNMQQTKINTIKTKLKQIDY